MNTAASCILELQTETTDLFYNYTETFRHGADNASGGPQAAV